MDTRLKRLLFRAHHMGSNENDILFGTFAERNLSRFSNAQLDKFEKLLQENDTDLFNWITGKTPVPIEFDHDVMGLLKSFDLFDGSR